MAVVTTEFSKVLKEELTCSFCNDIFKDPRILQCYHKFCFKCIEEWIEKHSKEEQGSDCPICKKEIVIPDGKVSELKPSFYIETLLQLLTAIKNSDMDDNDDMPSCVSCDKTCKLTTFCPQCGGMICDECLRIHNTLRVFKEEHQATVLKSFKREHLNTYIRSELRCHEKSHEKNKLEYFCKTCRQSICQECAMVDHNNHTKISIEEASECNQTKQLKSIDMESVTDLKEKYMKELQASKTQVDRYGKETEAAIRKVRESTLRYMGMIREHEMLMIAKLNELYREQHEKYDAEEKMLKSALSFFTEFDLQGQALQDKGIAHLILQSQHELPQYEELMKSKLVGLAEYEKSAKCDAKVEYVTSADVTQHLKDLGTISH